MSNGVMKPQEVADYLHISKTALYRRLELGKIPGAFKLGGSWYIHTNVFYEKLREMGEAAK